MRQKNSINKKLKTSVSPLKSTSPLKSSSKAKLSHSPTSQKINMQETVTINFSKNRQMLTKQLDTYTLLIRSKNPIRCLEHNSNISIYCETEQKLLCANCIFGRVEHKFHRVTPIDHSYEKIEKDVDTMNRLIERQVGAMKHTGQSLMQSLVQEQNDAHEGLTDLVRQYQTCHERLQECFLNSKNKIIGKLEKVRRSYETMLLQLKLHLQNYDLSNVVKHINKDYFKKEQFLLFEHVVCSAIAGQRKFDERQWLRKKREVHKVSGEEKKKILLMLELVNRLTVAEKTQKPQK